MIIKQIVIPIIAILAFCLTNVTNADVLLFDTGLSVSKLSSFARSDYDNSSGGSQFFFADDFELQNPSFVSRITWSGIYATVYNEPPELDDFEIAFFVDDGSSQTPVDQPFVVFDVGNNVSRTDSGFDFFDADIFEYSADIPALQIIPNSKF